ncbi:uncharacterized protein V1518DRAFT_417861, partial [Limtongia smithiae]|uniref:uncharacterized protein n=1 Tax=Limtongia smithiae TaxID=1125753 RepID=UPI0034CFC8B8
MFFSASILFASLITICLFVCRRVRFLFDCLLRFCLLCDLLKLHSVCLSLRSVCLNSVCYTCAFCYYFLLCIISWRDILLLLAEGISINSRTADSPDSHRILSTMSAPIVVS